MKPSPFAYARAGSLDEALALLAEAGEDAKLLAGGQSLVPLMSYRLAAPSHLVDLGGIAGLDAVEPDDGGLTVGALTRHATLARSSLLSGPWQALRTAAGLIGHGPIRTRGTFGGSLAHADPSAELPAVAAALDATVVVSSLRGERRLPAAELATGPLMTVLEADEAVVGACFPAPPDGLRSAFAEFSSRCGDWALASAAAACAVDAGGRVAHARIVLGAVGPTPLRAHAAEAALHGGELTGEAIAEAAAIAAGECDPAGDRHANAAFRRELVTVLVRRVLHEIEAGR